MKKIPVTLAGVTDRRIDRELSAAAARNSAEPTLTGLMKMEDLI